MQQMENRKPLLKGSQYGQTDIFRRSTPAGARKRKQIANVAVASQLLLAQNTGMMMTMMRCRYAEIECMSALSDGLADRQTASEIVPGSRNIRNSSANLAIQSVKARSLDARIRAYFASVASYASRTWNLTHPALSHPRFCRSCRWRLFAGSRRRLCPPSSRNHIAYTSGCTCWGWKMRARECGWFETGDGRRHRKVQC